MIVTEYAELVEARRRVARMQAEHVCDEHCAHRALIGEIVRPEVPITESCTLPHPWTARNTDVLTERSPKRSSRTLAITVSAFTPHEAGDTTSWCSGS